MTKQEEDRVKQILQRAMPQVDPAAESARDLWPAVLRRIDAEPAAASGPARQNWFDWALLAGLVVFAVSFPAMIPVFLYYL